MFQPVGPLPPSVYWRRRAVAAASAVIVPACVVWGSAAALSSDGESDDAAAAPASSPAPPPSPVASRSALSVPPGGSPALPGTDGTALGPTAPLPGAAGPTARAAVPPAGALEHCADDVLRVTATTDQESYSSGERPELGLVVRNDGPVACTRDLGPARQAMAVVVTPGDGLWGSDDCSPGGDPDVQTLQPGQEERFTVRWGGRTSRPGCPSGRTAVPPGDYQLITRLDGIESEPVRFTLEE